MVLDIVKGLFCLVLILKINFLDQLHDLDPRQCLIIDMTPALLLILTFQSTCKNFNIQMKLSFFSFIELFLFCRLNAVRT